MRSPQEWINDAEIAWEEFKEAQAHRRHVRENVRARKRHERKLPVCRRLGHKEMYSKPCQRCDTRSTSGSGGYYVPPVDPEKYGYYYVREDPAGDA